MAETSVAGTGQPDAGAPAAISGVRRHRSELKAAMVAFESAVTSRLDDPSGWLAPVSERFEALRQAFANHVAVHEGEDSFHAEVVRAQPHLSPRVSTLQREHRRLEEALARLGDLLHSDRATQVVDDIRASGADLLRRLTSHRRKGADLVWEAFNADLGGEH